MLNNPNSKNIYYWRSKLFFRCRRNIPFKDFSENSVHLLFNSFIDTLYNINTNLRDCFICQSPKFNNFHLYGPKNNRCVSRKCEIALSYGQFISFPTNEQIPYHLEYWNKRRRRLYTSRGKDIIPWTFPLVWFTFNGIFHWYEFLQK